MCKIDEKIEVNENKIHKLISGLKTAADECWKAKLATYEISKKYAALCIQVLHELGYVPKLINGRIQERIRITDGMNVLSEDFWTDENMIIALFEYVENEYGWEVVDASA